MANHPVSLTQGLRRSENSLMKPSFSLESFAPANEQQLFTIEQSDGICLGV